jgi:hypothetical protein
MSGLSGSTSKCTGKPSRDVSRRPLTSQFAKSAQPEHFLAAFDPFGLTAANLLV